jgi:hypothetical protein
MQPLGVVLQLKRVMIKHLPLREMVEVLGSRPGQKSRTEQSHARRLALSLAQSKLREEMQMPDLITLGTVFSGLEDNRVWALRHLIPPSRIAEPLAWIVRIDFER